MVPSSVLLLLFTITLFWLNGYNRLVVDRLSDLSWSLHSRVYARPLELYAKRSLSSEQLEHELHLLGYRHSSNLQPGEYYKFDSHYEIHTRGFTFIDGEEPGRQFAVYLNNNKVDRLETESDLQPLYRLEPLQIASLHTDRAELRSLVTVDDYPDGFAQALLAVEDRQFHAHRGISLRGMLRAAWVNLREGSKRQGASTLTQQLAKNLWLSPEKTWRRKIEEIGYALALENNYDKQTILETFVNEVFLTQSGQQAIHGFGLASRYFFAMPFNELQPHQYALLIGMLKAPSRYHPVRNPEAALQRRNTVLDILYDQQLLTEEEWAELREESLGLSESEDHQTSSAYVDAVRRQLMTRYDVDELSEGGMRIFTHYDPWVQFQLNQSVEQQVRHLDASLQSNSTEDTLDGLQQDTLKDKPEIAAIVSEPFSGNLLAMTGGRNQRYAGFNRALDAARPVGSLLKPFIYLTAWEKPDLYTLSTTLEDKPISMDLPNNTRWSPQNYNEKYRGSVSALAALTHSINIPAVNLGMSLGVESVVETLNRLGLEKPLAPLPSLLLGAANLTPMEVTQLYQSVAAGGYSVAPSSIQAVTDSDNVLLEQKQFSVSTAINSTAVYLLKFALAETMRSGTGKSIYQSLPTSFTVAGKTGTTDQARDNWFAGFSGDILSVIWVGFDDNRATGWTGASAALPVFTDFLPRISRESLDMSLPPDVELLNVDLERNRRIMRYCASASVVPYWQLKRQLPRTGCRSRNPPVGRWLLQ